MAAKSDTTVTVTVASDTEALLADHQHANSEDESATETKGGAIIKRCLHFFVDTCGDFGQSVTTH